MLYSCLSSVIARSKATKQSRNNNQQSGLLPASFLAVRNDVLPKNVSNHDFHKINKMNRIMYNYELKITNYDFFSLFVIARSKATKQSRNNNQQSGLLPASFLAVRNDVLPRKNNLGNPENLRKITVQTIHTSPLPPLQRRGEQTTTSIFADGSPLLRRGAGGEAKKRIKFNKINYKSIKNISDGQV